MAKKKKKAAPEKNVYQPKKQSKSSLTIIMGVVLACSVLIITGLYFRISEQKKEATIKELSALDAMASISTQVQEENEKNPPELIKKIEIDTQPPQINANAYGIYYRDRDTPGFSEMYSYNPDNQHPPASLTKLMTALVAVEQYPLDKEVLIPSNCVGINGSSIGLQPLEIYTLQDLIYGLLVTSAADAGCAIASIDNTSLFIEKMNTKAESLGMDQTKYQNVIGFDAGEYQVSSINDLKILSQEVLSYSTLRKIMGTEIVNISPKNSATVYQLENTNELLIKIPGTVGLKTGFTDQAGECLAYLYEENGDEIMIIILGSQDRFGDTTQLLEWAKFEVRDIDRLSDTPQ